MLSFFQPCLKWKYIVASHSPFGIPGFVAPFLTTYFSMRQVVITVEIDEGVSTTTTIVSNTTIDPLTSVWTSDVPPPYEYTSWWGMGDIVSSSAAGSYAQKISDSSVLVDIVVNGGGNGLASQHLEISLGNPMGPVDLERLVDALLAFPSWDSIPWMSGATVGYQNGIKKVLGMNSVFDTVPLPNYPSLQAFIPIAGTYYYPTAPGLFGQKQGFTTPITSTSNGIHWAVPFCAKMIALVALAGNYRRETFLLDLNAVRISDTFLPGTGSCAAPFLLSPSEGITPGQQPFIQIDPLGT